MSDFMSQIRYSEPTLLVTKPQDIYNELYLMLYLLELIHNTLRFEAKEVGRSVVELRIKNGFQLIGYISLNVFYCSQMGSFEMTL